MLTWLPFYLVRERVFSTTEMAQLAGAALLYQCAVSMLAGWVHGNLEQARPHADCVQIHHASAHGGNGCFMRAWAVASKPVAWRDFLFQVLIGGSSPASMPFRIYWRAPEPPALGGRPDTRQASPRWWRPPPPGSSSASTHHFTAAFSAASEVTLLGLHRVAVMLPKHRGLPGRQGRLCNRRTRGRR